ncbi:RRP15-like protein [Gracilariopsis chorda]|uniref:RRP15-like protein n=1 Tax=Gracilariopsis chorda TaxID=448386 RepID=A0A2V3IWY7_9FLOR|nr:RRP15-like protein [Gracilariopsis chorda]|eukprot:PXF46631.1 RRP15-like protein [Gracilariopsis chorda]
MVPENTAKKDATNGNPAVLSEGASVALGNVFKRLVGPEKRKISSRNTKKRLSSVVLGQSEEVEKALVEQAEEKKRLKKARKAKIEFENNGRVIPDAATGAALEKELLLTATKGAVALFNAVAKAQKEMEKQEEEKNRNRKKGPPVSRESFMAMMKSSWEKSEFGPSKGTADGDAEEDEIDENEDAKKAHSRARWLKDDFLTARSRTLKDWDRKDGNDGTEEDDSSYSDGTDNESHGDRRDSSGGNSDDEADSN